MEIKASLKYVRVSSKKVVGLARLLRGKTAAKALEMTKCIRSKSAKLLGNLLMSAMSNAENNNNLPASDLVVGSMVVTDGPVFKRFIPAARGSAHPIRKRTSYISVVLKKVESH